MIHASNGNPVSVEPLAEGLLAWLGVSVWLTVALCRAAKRADRGA